MLNKKVCHKCYTDSFFDAFIPQGVRDNFDVNWDIHQLSCINGKGFEKWGRIRHDGAPPKGCPYKFEHGVSEGMECM